MGIFGNIFKKSDQQEKKEVKSNVNWIPLKSLEQIELIKKKSKTKPVAIFKHSTRCGISRSVIKSFDSSFSENLTDKIDVYYLDLLNHRDLSSEVGYAFQVLHQSPQLLLISKGKAVLHASHYDIARVDLEKIVK